MIEIDPLGEAVGSGLRVWSQRGSISIFAILRDGHAQACCAGRHDAKRACVFIYCIDSTLHMHTIGLHWSVLREQR